MTTTVVSDFKQAIKPQRDALERRQEIAIVQKVYDQLIICGKRHRLIVGGRGKGASWSIARTLLTEGLGEPLFVACVREVQKTIKYSVKKLLDQQIVDLNLDWFYTSTDNEIRGLNGTLFAFFGLHDYNADNIKSLEGADRCWVAEAQSISRISLNILRPTIRKEYSVLWYDLNPRYATDPVYVDYVTNEDLHAEVCYLNWRDNPWFTDALRMEMESDYRRDETEARHIWEGELRDMGERYVCPINLVDIARNNDILNAQGEIVVGADIAHQGGDEIVFYKRMANKVIDSYFSRLQDTVDTTRDLKQFMGDRSVVLNIDNGHVGAAVADNMEKDKYTVNRINFGGTPKDTEHYEDIATELWFELRDQLPFIDIPTDAELRSQLIQRKYAYINGKRGYEVMKIESKKDYADHAVNINKSPDRADALTLTFYNALLHDMGMGTLSHNIYGGR